MQTNPFIKAKSGGVDNQSGPSVGLLDRIRSRLNFTRKGIAEQPAELNVLQRKSSKLSISPTFSTSLGGDFENVGDNDNLNDFRSSTAHFLVTTFRDILNRDRIGSNRPTLGSIGDVANNFRNSVTSRTNQLMKEFTRNQSTESDKATVNPLRTINSPVNTINPQSLQENSMATVLKWISDSGYVDQATKVAGSSVDVIASTIQRMRDDFNSLDFEITLPLQSKSIANQKTSIKINAIDSLESTNKNMDEPDNIVSSIMLDDETNNSPVLSIPAQLIDQQYDTSSNGMVYKIRDRFRVVPKVVKTAFTLMFPITSRIIRRLSIVKPKISLSPTIPEIIDNTPVKLHEIQPIEDQIIVPSIDYVNPIASETLSSSQSSSESNNSIINLANYAWSSITNILPWNKQNINDATDEKSEDSSRYEEEILSRYDPTNSIQNQRNIPLPLVVGSQSIASPFSSSSSSITKPIVTVNSSPDLMIPGAFKDLSIDESFNFRMGRSLELRSRPNFIETDSVPLPTKADFAYINTRRVNIAVRAALAVKSANDAKDFMKEIGLKPILSAVLKPYRPEQRVEGIHGICRLMKMDSSVAASVASVPGFVSTLCDLIELPLRGFLSFKSPIDREKDLQAQYEAVALIKRMVRSSDAAVEILRQDVRLRKILSSVIVQGELSTAGNKLATNNITDAVTPSAALTNKSPNKASIKKQMNPRIVDLVDLKTHDMARVAAWGLGGVQWKPKQPGQKGLRILSLDGGGTRGVLTIALLKELMIRANKTSPCDCFDIICGTSTGGIIAGLLGILKTTVNDTETMYDNLINKVFGQKSNLKLVVEQAAYDELEFENILYNLLQDNLMLDSNQRDCPRVFFVSTKVNINPPQIQIWRNYNYPPGQVSRYGGTFRVNSRTAVRATTAAPTYFTPVQFEGGLYCDGALVANNPTAIALQEAKALYPNIPVELVVSLGTGFSSKNSNVQSLGWDLLVNHLIASSTDTEDVHSLLVDFLPPDKYFRLNPMLQDNIAIDEKNKTALDNLKILAQQTWKDIDRGPNAKRFEQLVTTLKGGK